MKALADTHLHGHGDWCGEDVQTELHLGIDEIRHLATYSGDDGICGHRKKLALTVDAYALFGMAIGEDVRDGHLAYWPQPADPTPQPPECSGNPGCLCRDDIVVGAYGAVNGLLAGRSYVVFGKADTTAVDLGTLGGGGFRIDGAAANDRSGVSVSGAGDVNGDGMDDLIVGASLADANATDSGRSYVVFGKADTGAVELGMLGDGGFTLDGEAEADESGSSVSGAGDVNGDGLDDLIVGAPQGNGNSSGWSYVVFGKADATAVDLGMLGAGGFVLSGNASVDLSGFSVSGAGDVNGDGLDDLIVGAPGAVVDDAFAAGRSYVVFGKADATAVELGTLGAGGFALVGEAVEDTAGSSVSGAGDVNGDGMDDLIIGAPGSDPNGSFSGRSYVVFGVPTADNCCSPHTRGGCTDAVFAACVCDVDAACCDDEWDDTCVGEAADQCGACG